MTLREPCSRFVPKTTLTLEENPTGGETVEIGGRMFTFVTEVQNDNEIIIGADVEATVRNAHALAEELKVLVAKKEETCSACGYEPRTGMVHWNRCPNKKKEK